MWNIKTEIKNILTRANKTISNSSRNYLNNTPGNHEIKALQKKIAILALWT